jgi:hypothetical protein
MNNITPKLQISETEQKKMNTSIFSNSNLPIAGASYGSPSKISGAE